MSVESSFRGPGVSLSTWLSQHPETTKRASDLGTRVLADVVIHDRQFIDCLFVEATRGEKAHVKFAVELAQTSGFVVIARPSSYSKVNIDGSIAGSSNQERKGRGQEEEEEEEEEKEEDKVEKEREGKEGEGEGEGEEEVEGSWDHDSNKLVFKSALDWATDSQGNFASVVDFRTISKPARAGQSARGNIFLSIGFSNTFYLKEAFLIMHADEEQCAELSFRVPTHYASYNIPGCLPVAVHVPEHFPSSSRSFRIEPVPLDGGAKDAYCELLFPINLRTLYDEIPVSMSLSITLLLRVRSTLTSRGSESYIAMHNISIANILSFQSTLMSGIVDIKPEKASPEGVGLVQGWRPHPCSFKVPGSDLKIAGLVHKGPTWLERALRMMKKMSLDLLSRSSLSPKKKLLNRLVNMIESHPESIRFFIDAGADAVKASDKPNTALLEFLLERSTSTGEV